MLRVLSRLKRRGLCRLIVERRCGQERRQRAERRKEPRLGVQLLVRRHQQRRLS